MLTEKSVIVQGVKQKTSCSICGNGHVDCAIELPQFPLTGVFVREDDRRSFPKGYDQELVVCPTCGHVQLTYVLPSTGIYTSDYAHRSSISHLSSASMTFFRHYIDHLAPDLVFKCVLEIGCNDFFLLNQLANKSKSLVGIDPIWAGVAPPTSDSEVRVIGKFLEDVDFDIELEDPPDLIISTHNLEHIDEPVVQYQRIMAAAADNALFVVEIPDVDLMVDNLRFDQVFHYHLHYFGLHSLQQFIRNIGGEYIGHTLNYRNWGGSLIVAFRKRRIGNDNGPASRKLGRELITERHGAFRRRMAGFMEIVKNLKCDIWGYGAGQMIPSVAYNLGSDLSFLRGILDDNPSRDGMKYPHLPVLIRQPKVGLSLEDAAVMVTALDSVRPIMNRLQSFNPRYVLVPSDVF